MKTTVYVQEPEKQYLHWHLFSQLSLFCIIFMWQTVSSQQRNVNIYYHWTLS